jgi:hypothetical protein
LYDPKGLIYQNAPARIPGVTPPNSDISAERGAVLIDRKVDQSRPWRWGIMGHATA